MFQDVSCFRTPGSKFEKLRQICSQTPNMFASRPSSLRLTSPAVKHMTCIFAIQTSDGWSLNLEDFAKDTDRHDDPTIEAASATQRFTRGVDRHAVAARRALELHRLSHQVRHIRLHHEGSEEKKETQMV